MSPVLRFAPSPTGLLHVGNARVALVNWLFARRHGGRFLLRIDDTDLERSEARFEAAIEEDLRWLGLEWDAKARQSDRTARYDAAAGRLRAAGRLYPCYETPEELEAMRRRRRARFLPPVYDRAALALSAADRARLEAEGRRPHWRFRLDHEAIAWDDLVRGPARFDGANLSDPVLLRADGRPLFAFTSALDDVELGITHVVRGEDHVSTTAAQVQIFAALGAPPPAFAHLPLMTDAAGQGLSKRLGSLSLSELRAGGIEPLALAAYLARIGTPDPVAPAASLEALAEDFDLARFGRAPPRFDPAELKALNARHLHALPFEAVSARLAELGLAGADAAFWDAVRPNLERLGDASGWYAVCRGAAPAPAHDAPPEAAALLPPEPWDESTWGAWTRAVSAATGRKGRPLFQPLRLALTGRDHGPEMSRLLPLIGRERALKRLGARPDSLSRAAGEG